MLLYYGIVPHVRGSAVVQGTTDDSETNFIATPLERQLDPENNPEDQQKLWRLLDDVVATGIYKYYEWEPSDE
jgi:hypothetical protein